MTTKNNDSTTTATDYREKSELAEKLVEEMAIGDEVTAPLLLLIDLFEENRNNPLLISVLAGCARMRAFSRSDRAEQESHEYVRSLRASHLANLSSVQEEAGSPASDDEEHDTQPDSSASQRKQASLAEEKEQPIAARTDASQPGNFSAQRERVRHLARKISQIGAREADALFELLAYIEPESSTRSAGQHLLWSEAQSIAFSETFAGCDAEEAYRQRFTDQFREEANESSADTESEEHSVN
jgi:hypothetical protein